MKAVKRIKRSLEEIQISANRFTKRSDFAREDNASYRAAKKREDFEQIVAHMSPSLTKAKTLEEIQHEANKYSRRVDFERKSNGVYQAAVKREDFEQIVAHMDKPFTKAYSLEELKEEALKYNTRSLFKKGNSSAYNAAQKRDDFEQIVAHMEVPSNEPYTIEELREITGKCKSKGELYKKYPSVYNIINKHMNKKELTSHMPEHVDQSGKNNPMYGKTVEGRPAFNPSLEEIQHEVNKYSRRTELFKANQPIYNAARRREDYESIVAHMKVSDNSSASEDSLFDYIKNIFPKAQKLRDKKVKIEDKPHIQGFELDIYIPELRKAIEFDGRYYHSFKGLKRGRPHWPDEDIRNYHQLKDSWFASKGIRILHIKEVDWNRDKEECIQKCLDFLFK